MKLACLVLVLVFFSSPTLPRNSGQPCRQGCTTIFRVLDCSRLPVARMKVRIKLCCDDKGEHTGTTNAQGEVSFPYCLADICERQVQTDSPQYENCATQGNVTKCTITLCQRRVRIIDCPLRNEWRTVRLTAPMSLRVAGLCVLVLPDRCQVSGKGALSVDHNA